METPGAKDRERCMRRTCSEEGAVRTQGGPKEHMGWQDWPSKGVRGMSAKHWEHKERTNESHLTDTIGLERYKDT